jgi:hypothetical protein
VRAPKGIVGRKHPVRDGRVCNCGCGRTPGRYGTLVRNSDTPKLEDLGMAVYEFPPFGPMSRVTVCYRLAELEPTDPTDTATESGLGRPGELANTQSREP